MHRGELNPQTSLTLELVQEGKVKVRAEWGVAYAIQGSEGVWLYYHVHPMGTGFPTLRQLLCPPPAHNMSNGQRARRLPCLAIIGDLRCR